MPRRFPIFQLPNPPLIAALLAGGFAQTTSGRSRIAGLAVSRIALAVWSYQEIVSGANWFRRLLGMGAGAYSAAGFAGVRRSDSAGLPGLRYSE